MVVVRATPFGGVGLRGVVGMQQLAGADLRMPKSPCGSGHPRAIFQFPVPGLFGRHKLQFLILLQCSGFYQAGRNWTSESHPSQTLNYQDH